MQSAKTQHTQHTSPSIQCLDRRLRFRPQVHQVRVEIPCPPPSHSIQTGRQTEGFSSSVLESDVTCLPACLPLVLGSASSFFLLTSSSIFSHCTEATFARRVRPFKRSAFFSLSRMSFRFAKACLPTIITAANPPDRVSDGLAGSLSITFRASRLTFVFFPLASPRLDLERYYPAV